MVSALVQACIGTVMVAAPQPWYNTTPGVAAGGPFNGHFIIDIGLAFLLSAGALAYGAWQSNRGVALVGATWPMLHAFFHLSTWLRHGFPASAGQFWAEMIGVVMISVIGFAAAWLLPVAGHSDHH